MALPIKPTPTLYGAEARRFLKRMEANKGQYTKKAAKPDMEKAKRIAFGNEPNEKS